MEGLKPRSYIIAALFMVCAALAYWTPKPGAVAGRTESWMEQVAPAKVASYSYIPDENPQDGDTLCTYKSPKMVYDALVPTVGILARVYENAGQKYDVTLIASRDKASFHDPRVCFTAQKYNITEEKEVTIHTQTRGDIPATFAKMDGPQGPTVAVYFYRGPNNRFFSNTTNLKVAMLWEQVKGTGAIDGVFYRFIPIGDLDADRLFRFIGTYMDEAAKESNGYF